MTETTDYTHPSTPVPERERGEFIDRKPPKSPGQKVVIVGIALLAAGVMAYSAAKLAGMFGGDKKQTTHVEEQKRIESTPDFSVPLTDPPKPELRFVECAGGLKLPEGMTCPPTNRPEQTAKAAQEGPKGPTEEEILQKRRFESEVDVGGNKGSAEAGAGGVLAGHSLGEGGLGGTLKATATAKSLATVNRNPSFTLSKGTLPDCTLLTAISSDQPGFLKCIISRPVYSMDGKVVLMEAGTTVEGEYGAGMARGKKRMFVVWSRAVTPNNVEVTLDSPGTDALGRSGMSGEIDQHFLERFGGAMLYSLFSDGMNYAVQNEQLRMQQQAALDAAGNGNSGTINNTLGGPLQSLTSTRSTADSIVQAMLKQGQDIQPTLYKNQGEIIKIYVARDVDFSQVYELKRNPRS